MTNNSTLQTTKKHIDQQRISMTSERTHENPNMDDARCMDHYRCILKMGRKRLTVVFSKGFGHKGVHPTAEEVLDCLASDASGYENSSGFPDWAESYGYDPDSRSAERTYNTVKRQADKLRNFLGGVLYENLLNHTERL